MENNSDEWKISYKQLGIIITSFVLGLIVALLASNSQASSVTNFTTTELIGFVLSVVLSGASIVLAIAAITLGKSSEQAVISRSDESIRLQTEVFTKTTDALQSIKASTDVTEKRIEDIISGRAGDISRQIAELASDETETGAIDVKELEEKIRKSITGTFEKEVNEEEKNRRAEIRKEAKKRRDKYEKYHNELLYGLANKNQVEILKLAHGSPQNTDIENYSRYDGVFKKNEKITAVSTFMPAINKAYASRNMSDIVSSLAVQVADKTIDQLYFILFDEGENDDAIDQIKQTISLMKQDIASKFEVISMKYDEVQEWVTSQEL